MKKHVYEQKVGPELCMDIKMQQHCDRLLVFGKPTAGVSVEIAYGMKYDIPIYCLDTEGRLGHHE